MKNQILYILSWAVRIIGFMSLLALVLVFTSVYEFVDRLTPFTLMALISLWIVFDMYHLFKSSEYLEKILGYSVILVGIILLLVWNLRPLLAREPGFLVRPSSKQIDTGQLRISGYKRWRSKDYNRFTLSKFAISGLLIRDVETVIGEWNDSIQIVDFPFEGISFNHVEWTIKDDHNGE